MKNKNRLSSSVLISIYLIISIVGLLLVVRYFDNLITSHDRELTADVASLIAEKMNRSIDYMQKSVDEMATVLSYQDLLEFDQLYGQLEDSLSDSDYISIGIISEDGQVYGRDSEKNEMNKWELSELSFRTQEVSISEPYRSTMTGKLVFTMFSPVYQQGERLGCIFVTYPLAEIQDIANTAVLQDKVEIYLANCNSENMIICSGSNEYLVGNWNSARLMKRQISEASLGNYEKWEKLMKNGVEEGTVQFDIENVTYTQVFRKIAAMDGWNVVVRIPNKSLSNDMQNLRTASVIFVFMLLILSLLVLYSLHSKDVAERERFEYMSTHDALTDVYNRNAFDLVVQKALDERKASQKAALVFLDIDYFKQINDNFGHDVGDRTLVAFANILKELFGKDSVIARYGGDEFVLLVQQYESEAALNERLRGFLKRLSEVKLLEYDDERYSLHYSAGIVACPEYGQHFEELVKFADIALYETKEAGRNGFRWYKGDKEV